VRKERAYAVLVRAEPNEGGRKETRDGDL